MTLALILIAIMAAIALVCIFANEVIKFAARKCAEDAGYRDAHGDWPKVPDIQHNGEITP